MSQIPAIHMRLTPQDLANAETVIEGGFAMDRTNACRVALAFLAREVRRVPLDKPLEQSRAEWAAYRSKRNSDAQMRGFAAAAAKRVSARP